MKESTLMGLLSIEFDIERLTWSINSMGSDISSWISSFYAM